MQLVDNRHVMEWCADFKPSVKQMVFSLARDSSWEKGGQKTNISPSLRKIPLHAILAEDRVHKQMNNKYTMPGYYLFVPCH